ncbi:unnamed protein product [Protopolystoma xenopodis]|uniref:Uncharacterized protein n=1 Tax=Protopolystoma xenopodis TaxID=117903 RepID=A0A448WII6_9PLAT|nr:unnamed protein product [Protopolystoma xenopodis]
MDGPSPVFCTGSIASKTIAINTSACEGLDSTVRQTIYSSDSLSTSPRPVLDLSRQVHLSANRLVSLGIATISPAALTPFNIYLLPLANFCLAQNRNPASVGLKYGRVEVCRNSAR